MLQIEHVSKHFHSKRNRLLVLDDISLSVGKGEFLCITGPSGCGKTTLLNIVAGLDPASKGRVLVNGAEIKGPGIDRAVVFQEPALFPWLTVIENVEFPMKTAGEQRFDLGRPRVEHLPIDRYIVSERLLKGAVGFADKRLCVGNIRKEADPHLIGAGGFA